VTFIQNDPSNFNRFFPLIPARILQHSQYQQQFQWRKRVFNPKKKHKKKRLKIGLLELDPQAKGFAV